MDARIQGQYSLSAALKAATVAVKCLSTEPKFRPTMDEVVKTLEQLQETTNDVEPKIFDSRSSNGPRRNRAEVNENRDRKSASYPTASASPLRV